MDAQARPVRRVHQVFLDLRVLMENQESREKQESLDIPVFQRSRSARETRESRVNRDFLGHEALLATTASRVLRERRAKSVSPVSTARQAWREDLAPKDTLVTPDLQDQMENLLLTSTPDQKETKEFLDRQVSPVSRDSKVKPENQDFQDQMDRPATQVLPLSASRANKETQE